jgi:hypothetical protein
MSDDAKATLVNLRYVNGELKAVFHDAQGKEILKDIEGMPTATNPPPSTTEFNGRFIKTDGVSKTDHIPMQDVGPKTSPLIKKDIAKQYTHAIHDHGNMMEFIQKHLDTTIALHAGLIEVFGAPENFTDERASKARESLVKEPRFKAYINKNLLLMGDVWADVYKKLNS